MPTNTTPDEQTNIQSPIKTTHPNGLTDEQIQEMLAALGRRKNDPEYVQRLLEGAEEARRRLNAEALRELESQENK